ncbi:MAG TPA: helix-turn-helix transcriptional regulator [Clostridia bacterium]|nr:helix-turn-helix transcriptional regulator [Clostridia bacterium]
MAEKCLTSEKLSKITGVSQVTIARMKNGSQKPRPITIGKIAKALGIKPEELIED